MDGNETVGTAGGKAQNDLISEIVVEKNNDDYSGYLFGELTPSELRGYAYVDVDRDSNFDSGDRPLQNSAILLTGIDDRGAKLEQKTQTLSDGSYNFPALRPGTYEITAETPAGYTDGRESLGRFDENPHSISENGDVYNDRFSNIQLGVGQTGRNYTFGEFDPSIVSGVLATEFAKDVVIDGTSGDDLFEFIVGADQLTVVLNGQSSSIPTDTTTRIVFYGHGGNNSAQLTGGAGIDQVELRETSAKLTGVSYQVVVYTTRAISAQSGGGEDRALFYDTTGDDLFAADGLGATLTGNNYQHQANDFHRAYAYATLGNDTVELTGTAGNDYYTATPTDARMQGAGYYNYSRGFDVAHGYAGNGADDRAYLHGTTGTDYFIAEGNETRLYNNSSYDNYAHGFDRSYAYGSGGTDFAYFYDTTDSDYYRVDDDGARMYTGGYYNRAINFTYHNVTFNPNDGKTDKVAIYDSAGNDLFVAIGNQVLAYRGATVHRILNPDLVEAHADLGNDRYYTSNINFELRLLGDWNPYYTSVRFVD